MRAALLVPLCCILFPACGMSYGVGAQHVASLNEPTMPLELVHEPCDHEAAGSVHIDTDHDGSNDAVQVLSGGREICRALDTNHDGKPDAYVYFDPTGGVRRHETDHNHDGRIDEVAHFQAGIIQRKDRSTGHTGTADHWEVYENGNLVRHLHDRDGNGRVDEWAWLHPHNKLCATVHTDHDGDGQADAKEDRCTPASASASAAAPASAPPAAPASAAPPAPR
jgi:hypothetical protein